MMFFVSNSFMPPAPNTSRPIGFMGQDTNDSHQKSLPKEHADIAIDFLRRFKIEAKAEDLTYHVYRRWTDLDLDLRKKLDEDDFDIERAGFVGRHPDSGKFTAYIFTDFIKQRCAKDGTPEKDAIALIALQEAAGKLLLENSMDADKAELVSEAIMAKANPGFAFTKVLPNILMASIGRLQGNYKSLVNAAIESSVSVLKAYGIIDENSPTPKADFVRLFCDHVFRVKDMMNENPREIQESFMALLAGKSAVTISAGEIAKILAQAYADGLDKKAKL